MLNSKNPKHKPLYKKFVTLKININNNNKIIKLKKQKWKDFPVTLWGSLTTIKNIISTLEKLKKEKIEKSMNKKLKTKRILITPIHNYNYNNYSVTKFASQGNSFKKMFKKDLIAKKTFNYFYGGLVKKYLKKRMTHMYNCNKFYNIKQVCLEFFESRLDSILYRTKLCLSAKSARQLISHNIIKVNGNAQKNKSYILKAGDVVCVGVDALHIIRHNLTKTIKKHKNKTNILRSILRKPVIIEPPIFNTFLTIWPITPNYLITNYKTLEIVFVEIKNFNFSTSFPFKLNYHSIIMNYYRH